jgi:ABC-type branched-subunit amino acid transport system substrate-binding protein
MRRKRSYEVALLAIVLASGACSGSGDDESAPDATGPDVTEATDTTDAPGTTEPVEVTDDRAFRVMVIGDETSTISFAVPEAVPAVEAAFAETPNVEVLHCDSAGDANASLDCQREAVSEGVAAVIGSFGSIAQDASVLADAGIPVVGGAPPDATNGFSLSAGLPVYASLGVAAVEAGCGSLATLYLDGAEFLADMVADGAALGGVEEAARSGIPQNTPDVAPQVAALAGSDADCVVLSVTPTQVVQAVTALNQAGVDAQLIAAGAVVTPPVVEELGELAEGIITTEVQLSPGEDDPVVQDAHDRIAAVDPDAAFTTLSLLSWASAQLIIDALPAIEGDVTSASLTEALDGLVDAPAGGVVHPVTTNDLENPQFARFYNPWGLLYRIEDGEPVRVSDDYFSLEETLNSVTVG